MTDDQVVEGHVTSRDGTRIGYLRQGNGPGLVLVQGAMGTARDYSELAQALAPHFTIYSSDRRGRGLSARPYDPGHVIDRDVEDVDAVLAQTGTSRVFGLSSGAVITLAAAQRLPAIARAAIYEPPFYAQGISHEGIRRLNVDVEQGDLASALIRSLVVAQTVPAPLRLVPTSIARQLARAVLWVDSRRPGSSPPLTDLLPGIRYDFNVVGGIDGKMNTFALLDKPVLLLSGTKSPAFLQHSSRRLADVLPRAQLVQLEGLSHAGPWNRSRGGDPAAVAAALLDFLA